MMEEKNTEGNFEAEKNDELAYGSQEVDYKKRNKNYLSVIVLLAGLLLGSIFVDVAQFFSQKGMSPRALRQLEIIPFEGKTWVAYNEPVVTVQVLNDANCEECDITEAVKMMKRVIPTLLVQQIEFDSPEGKNLSEKMNVKSIPAFVFDEGITKTDIYVQAQDIFKKQEDKYLIDTAQIGIQPGKFLVLPEVKTADMQTGPADAKVKIFFFSDFQCPYCKSFYEQSLKKAMTEYKDKVLFVYKEVPLSIHDKAVDTALAAECAGEQGKFWEMADKLYSDQKNWSAAAKFSAAPYTSGLGLNLNQFNECVGQKKFADKIKADNEEAQNFGISGTPAVFVNDKFFGGVVQYEQLKAAIDEQLNM